MKPAVQLYTPPPPLSSLGDIRVYQEGHTGGEVRHQDLQRWSSKVGLPALLCQL